MLEDRIDEIAFDAESTRILTELIEAERATAVAQARATAAKVAYRDHVRSHARLTRSPVERVEVAAAADELGYVTATPAPVVVGQLAEADFVAARLPQVHAAHKAGLVDGYRLRVIVAAARKLHEPASHGRLDDEVCLRAQVNTVRQLQAWLRAFIARTEPDRQSARTRSEFAARGVWLHPTDDANAVLEAWLGGVDAERFETWLDRTARTTGGAGDERTLDQKRADIVADLLVGRRTIDDLNTPPADDPDEGTGEEPAWPAADQTADWAGAEGDAEGDPVAGVAEALGAGPVTGQARGESGRQRGRGARRTTGQPARPAGATTGPTTTATGAVIGVTVPIEFLTGLSDDPGITWATKTSLPAELVRELAVEPGTLFYRIFTDHAGGVLDVTELGRFPSHKLTTALRFRDQVCRVAHCDIPAVACDKDHQTPFPEGATTGSNLVHLCRRHHRLKTYGRLRATMLGPPPELTPPP